MCDDWFFGLWKPQPNHLLLPLLHGVCCGLYRTSLVAVSRRAAKKRTQILTAYYVDLSVQTS